VSGEKVALVRLALAHPRKRLELVHPKKRPGQVLPRKRPEPVHPRKRRRLHYGRPSAGP
jgi:hypothetical protein